MMTWSDALGTAFLTTLFLVAGTGGVAILIASGIAHPYLAYAMAVFVIVWFVLAVCFRRGWLK